MLRVAQEASGCRHIQVIPAEVGDFLLPARAVNCEPDDVPHRDLRTHVSVAELLIQHLQFRGGRTAISLPGLSNDPLLPEVLGRSVQLLQRDWHAQGNPGSVEHLTEPDEVVCGCRWPGAFLAPPLGIGDEAGMCEAVHPLVRQRALTDAGQVGAL
ncbi:hypothetical protein B1L07_14710 [Stenotrophomonas acidaminiphila]|nr:hypothetical protein B1L07_14710 [Stenotrophomonas acidaminiphila]